MSLAKCEFSKATYLVKVVEQENAHPFRAKVEALEFLPLLRDNVSDFLEWSFTMSF